jgi:hypothetical protein
LEIKEIQIEDAVIVQVKKIQRSINKGGLAVWYVNAKRPVLPILAWRGQSTIDATRTILAAVATWICAPNFPIGICV